MMTLTDGSAMILREIKVVNKRALSASASSAASRGGGPCAPRCGWYGCTHRAKSRAAEATPTRNQLDGEGMWRALRHPSASAATSSGG